MILFVFEGVKREPDLFRTIQRLYFSNREEQIVCSYNNNIYQLYKDLQEYDGDGDIVSLLMEKFASQKDNPLKGIDRSADISEIYLFFDYDFHNRNLSLEEINRQVKEMLETFNNETEYGKLYIDYPMVESIRYTKFCRMQTIGPIRYPVLIAAGLRDYQQNSQPIKVSILSF